MDLMPSSFSIRTNRRMSLFLAKMHSSRNLACSFPQILPIISWISFLVSTANGICSQKIHFLWFHSPFLFSFNYIYYLIGTENIITTGERISFPVNAMGFKINMFKFMFFILLSFILYHYHRHHLPYILCRSPNTLLSAFANSAYLQAV